LLMILNPYFEKGADQIDFSGVVRLY